MLVHFTPRERIYDMQGKEGLGMCRTGLDVVAEKTEFLPLPGSKHLHLACKSSFYSLSYPKL